MTKLIKVIWLFTCFAMLMWGFTACGQESNSIFRGECSLLSAIIMTLLSLPSGILWWLFVSGAGYALSLVGIEIEASAIANLIVGFGFVVVGYLQWFKLVPWLLAKWRSQQGTHFSK